MQPYNTQSILNRTPTGLNLDPKRIGYGSGPVTYAGTSPISSPGAVDNSAYNALLAAQAASDARIRALMGQINSQPRAATPDFAGINARARQTAEANVNPFYVKQLNDFLAQQQVKQTRKQEDYTRNITDLEDALKTSLETSQINRERTGEDVATNLGEITAQEDFSQGQEGTQFDQARLALLRQGEDAGAGQAQQEVGSAVTQRNVQAKEQARQVNVQKEAQNTFKTRTFADLGRSDKLAGEQTTKQKEVQKIDLDRYVQDIASETEQKRTGLEIERLTRLSEETRNQRSLGFQDFLKTISNPGTLAATAQAYGGMF